MIYTDDLLFLHVPKTGGMSIEGTLLCHLGDRVRAVIPEHEKLSQKSSHQLDIGPRHATIPIAKQYFEGQGKALEEFKRIFAVIRDPYDLEASRYHYLQKGRQADSGKNQQLAKAGDPAAFIRDSRWWFDFRDFYDAEKHGLDNLEIIRFENLKSEIEKILQTEFDIEVSLRHENRSQKRDSRSYGRQFIKSHLTDFNEQQFHEKYKFFFDSGWYRK